MDPGNGADLLCSQEGVHPVPRRGRREGGAGYGCCPIEVGGGDPQDPLKPVRTPVAIFGSLGVCIYVPASRHWLISYSLIHLT